MDVARNGEEARATHEAMQLAMRVEMARDMDVHHDDDIVHATLSLAVGAVILAAAQRTESGRAKVLKSARSGVNDLFDGYISPKIEDFAPPPPRPEVKPVEFDAGALADKTPPPRPQIPSRPVAATRNPPERPKYKVHKQKPLFEPEPSIIGKMAVGVKKLFS